MLFLFTDFGLRSSYVGQMKAAILRQAPQVPVIDLNHYAPAFDPQRAGYLLAAEWARLEPADVVVAVIDPGVGTSRTALALLADGVWLVGPDNGLFAPIWRRAVERNAFTIGWQPPRLSATFHGRDLFAPVAASLAANDRRHLVPMDQPPLDHGGADDLSEIVFIDDYGNAITGLRAATVPATARVMVSDQVFVTARTFADDRAQQGMWYPNSLGLVELSLREGSAAERFGLAVGTRVAIS